MLLTEHTIGLRGERVDVVVVRGCAVLMRDADFALVDLVERNDDVNNLPIQKATTRTTMNTSMVDVDLG